ncbi:MAG: polyamine aminopropyltransferase [Hyphomicrobiaceae bacterium]
MTRWVEETFHPHWRVRLEASRVLHEVKTEHQHLVIFENETWGTVLMLDGVCQLTTSDEFVYHEMMAHVPLMALSAPKRVLVIGGGDGGVLREVLKHPSVAKATLCEIDRVVIDLSLRYYPEIAGGAFDDPRADIAIADGLKYVAETREAFDAIIVDSSEPIGPSAVLHTRAFFTDCKRALKTGGILVTQNGLPFLFPEHLRATTEVFASLFKSASPFMCTQPCYFGGPFALNAASDGRALQAVSASTLASRMAKRGIKTRYYTPKGHLAAFALPGYVEKIVAEAKSGLPRGKAKAPARSKASAGKGR